uniref:Vitellogenin 3 n=1 Tax=Odontomachus monticola TaxID=613454 RepID=A0A348G626_ODOMO
MNVVVIPFFLAAHVTVEKPWEHGPEYVFQVQVNSTAIPEEGIYGSVRLNLESQLICQPKMASHSLSCRFKDSVANSFVADSLDPTGSAVPAGPVSRQEAYEINEDRFEIKFNEKGMDSLLVNENIQPRELDMIRFIVGQLNIGMNFNDARFDDGIFDAMENFTQGECVTTFKIDRKVNARLHAKRGFALKPVLGLKDRKMLQIRKIRNLQMCTHKGPYFFGNAESLREVSDIVSDVTTSDSHIVVTSTDFISYTSNVITTSKITEAVITTLYENARLKLVSIGPAEREPPPVTEAEPVSIFIGRWSIVDSFEDDN